MAFPVNRLRVGSAPLMQVSTASEPDKGISLYCFFGLSCPDVEMAHSSTAARIAFLSIGPQFWSRNALRDRLPVSDVRCRMREPYAQSIASRKASRLAQSSECALSIENCDVGLLAYWPMWDVSGSVSAILLTLTDRMRLRVVIVRLSVLSIILFQAVVPFSLSGTPLLEYPVGQTRLGLIKQAIIPDIEIAFRKHMGKLR